MSLTNFVPTPKFEEYKERFKDHYKLERRADGVILVQAHTAGGPIQLSVENHRSVGQLFKTVGADPENEIMIFTGTGKEFMMDADPEGFKLEEEEPGALGLRVRLQGRPHQRQLAGQRSGNSDHRRAQRSGLPHRDLPDVRHHDLHRRRRDLRSALRHRLGARRRHSQLLSGTAGREARGLCAAHRARRSTPRPRSNTEWSTKSCRATS